MPYGPSIRRELGSVFLVHRFSGHGSNGFQRGSAPKSKNGKCRISVFRSVGLRNTENVLYHGAPPRRLTVILPTGHRVALFTEFSVGFRQNFLSDPDRIFCRILTEFSVKISKKGLRGIQKFRYFRSENWGVGF